MSGGFPAANALATIKHNGASSEPGISDAELVARRRKELGFDAAPPQPPDIADLALRDAVSGKVRKVRGGSARQSILGQSMALDAYRGP